MDKKRPLSDCETVSQRPVLLGCLFCLLFSLPVEIDDDCNTCANNKACAHAVVCKRPARWSQAAHGCGWVVGRGCGAPPPSGQVAKLGAPPFFSELLLGSRASGVFCCQGPFPRSVGLRGTGRAQSTQDRVGEAYSQGGECGQHTAQLA